MRKGGSSKISFNPLKIIKEWEKTSKSPTCTMEITWWFTYKFNSNTYFPPVPCSHKFYMSVASIPFAFDKTVHGNGIRGSAYSIVALVSVLQTMSIFRRQKYLICNSVCEMRFTIAFRVTDFSDADKSFCADHPSANTFPRTAVGKLCGLSITDTRRRCMPVHGMGYWRKLKQRSS